MKIRNRELEDVWSALSDLGANRLPYRLAARVHDMKRVVQEALERRDKLKADLAQPYMPAGKTIQSPMTEAEVKRLMGYDGYRAAQAKVRELMDDEVELHVGGPADLSKLVEDELAKLVLMETSHGTLKRYDLIVEPV